MITEILKQGNPVSEASTMWLRGKMSAIIRYRNLEPKITHFTIGRYKGFPMVLAWKQGLSTPIPIPKNELSHSKSKKTRVLTNLRKVVEYQVHPKRVAGMHVDHIYPFEAIVRDWLAANGLSWEKVTSKHYPSFDKYHLEVATYQLLTPAENIRKSNKL